MLLLSVENSEVVILGAQSCVSVKVSTFEIRDQQKHGSLESSRDLWSIKSAPLAWVYLSIMC
jgi:hypothetical protein